MSSQRNAPSFSRLRDVLPSIPSTSAESRSTNSNSVTSASSSSEDSSLVISEEYPLLVATTLTVAPDLRGRTTLPAKPGKRKALAKTATFRLPIELLDALRVVADYNNLNQGEIVSEAVHLHIQNFIWPPGPESEKLREQVRQLI